MVKLKENPVAGRVINMAGQDYIVPALPISSLKALQDKIGTATKEPDSLKQVEAAAEIIHAALRRNYPEITIEEVGEIVDLGNMGAVIAAALGQEPPGPGNALPAATPSASTKSTGTK